MTFRNHIKHVDLSQRDKALGRAAENAEHGGVFLIARATMLLLIFAIVVGPTVRDVRRRS